ncbi:MAG: FAD-binding oxidoreductase, partial [Comamonadaceae bacterium]
MIQAFAAVVGPTHVLTGTATVPFLTDWRDRYTGCALAVVLPGTTEEVAAVVALCARHGVPIVTQGGNTGLCGGATPDDSGRAIVLSTRRLSAVLALDPDNDTITVQA